MIPTFECRRKSLLGLIHSPSTLPGCLFTQSTRVSLEDCPLSWLAPNKMELLLKVGNCVCYANSSLNISLFHAKEIKNKIK